MSAAVSNLVPVSPTGLQLFMASDGTAYCVVRSEIGTYELFTGRFGDHELIKVSSSRSVDEDMASFVLPYQGYLDLPLSTVDNKRRGTWTKPKRNEKDPKEKTVTTWLMQANLDFLQIFHAPGEEDKLVLHKV